MAQNNLIRGIIDLDNVVSDWMTWYIEQIGSMPALTGLRTGKLTDMYPDIPVEELEKLVADRRGYQDTLPVENAPKSLRELLRYPNVRILYLSAAFLHAEDARRLWMEINNIPLDHPQVEGLLHLSTPEKPVGEDKVRWIEENGSKYDFILDDALHYLDAAWIAGIEYRYAFFQPWNSEDENHQIVFGWKDFLEKLRIDFPSLNLDNKNPS
jgi:hypothetical protein